MRPRVLLIDDHPVIGESLSLTLRGTLFAYQEQAFTVRDGLERVAQLRPDVVVVDLALPDGFGLDAVAQLRSQYPALGIVVFSMCDEAVHAEHALTAGAHAYVMKTEASEVLYEAIRSASRGEVFVSQRMTARLFRSSVNRPMGSVVSELTGKEREIFQLLGRGHTVDEIADRLGITRKTVEAHRRQAKEKLGFDLVAEVVQFAVQWEYGRATAQSAVCA